jgi:hypothetical protein
MKDWLLSIDFVSNSDPLMVLLAYLRSTGQSMLWGQECGTIFMSSCVHIDSEAMRRNFQSMTCVQIEKPQKVSATLIVAMQLTRRQPGPHRKEV